METATIIRHIRLLVGHLHRNGVDYAALQREIFGDGKNDGPLRREEEDRADVRHRSVLHAGRRRGHFSLHDHGAEIYLNPMERTLYRLFLSHPEGIAADSLPLYWNELRHIYFKESLYDDKSLMESKLESLCAESKTVFYSTVSRIKKKFTDAIGPDKADAFIIKRDHTGRYKTKATIR